MVAFTWVKAGTRRERNNFVEMFAQDFRSDPELMHLPILQCFISTSRS